MNVFTVIFKSKITQFQRAISERSFKRSANIFPKDGDKLGEGRRRGLPR